MSDMSDGEALALDEDGLSMVGAASAKKRPLRWVSILWPGV